MTDLRRFLAIVHLTLHEAFRRRILTASFVCGLAFLALYATGLHFMLKSGGDDASLAKAAERVLVLNFVTLAGLYAVNFLTVMSAVLLPVDTLAGEITSGVIQTVASKPVRRSSILLGKWIAYVFVVVGYLWFLAGGVLLVVRVLGHFTLPNAGLGLALMSLEAVVLLSVSIAGGTRLSTVTTGIVAFGLFGLAFIGNWVEQIGTFTANEASRTVGTIASLIMPSESLWMLAAHHMQPPIMSQLGLTPLSPQSVPTNAMIVWAGLYIVAALAFAARSLAKRPL